MPGRGKHTCRITGCPEWRIATTILGKRVRQFRRAAGFSQRQTAQRMGFSDRRPVARLELGKSQPSFVVLAALAKALDRSLEDLLVPIANYDCSCCCKVSLRQQ